MAPNGKPSLSYENGDVELLSSLTRKGYRTKAILHINGTRVPDKLAAQARPNQTLLSFLREVMGLTGSKLGCAEGGCGACTVLISKKEFNTDKIKHISVNACLMPVLAADGCHITTIEGIGTVKGDNLHPIQKAMVDMHGSQCGFCTPGIIVAIYGLFANNSTVAHLEEHLDGNLCRCTGYRPIWDAARSLCTDAEENLANGPCGTACRECPEREECEMDCNIEGKEEEKKLDLGTVTTLCCSSSLDKVQEYKASIKKGWLDQPNLMFPKELMDVNSVIFTELAKPLVIVDRSEYHSAGTWIKPSTLLDLLGILKEYGGTGEGGCKIVVGNTEVGIEARFKHAVYPRLVAPPESIETLFCFRTKPNLLEIGSCTSLSMIQHECEILSEDPIFSRTVKPISDMLRWFASTQIRNVACLGGNLVTASPISDMNPMLASMGARIVISSLGEDGPYVSQRRVPVSDFFLSYRKVDLKCTEIVEFVEVPVLSSNFEYLKPFKQARRREDDISIVTAGMKIKLAVEDGKWTIVFASFAFGGMAPKTIMSRKTTDFLEGKEFSMETFDEAREVLLQELQLPYDVPGGQATYRMTLAASFLHKFFVSVINELRVDVEKMPDQDFPPVPILTEAETTAAKTFVDAKKPSIRGVQKYPAPQFVKGLEDEVLPKMKEPVSGAKAKEHAVGKATSHMSGPLHCTGEALYTDDVPLPPSTLQAVLILTSECGGILESIDVENALTIEGVVGAFTYKDLEKIGGYNKLGPIVKDEFVFLPIGEKVATIGQVLGIVVGETLEVAEAGARAIEVKYGKPDEKVLVSIEDAIAACSFYDFAQHTLVRGDIAYIDSLSAMLTDNPQPGDTVTVEGSFMCGGQEHFYLETNSSLVVPSESDTNLTVYCSTQAPTKTQNYCASATGTPAAKVVVRMKRMGGGFGGKETRSAFASCAAAVAAKITCRPVRLTLARDVDMSITGTRHAFVSKYKASATILDDGSVALQALDVSLYSNGGYAFDLSGPVMDRALFHVDGCYFWPHFRAIGNICKTAQPAHTAYRGFGGPQAIATVEHIMDHLALECKVSVDSIRRSNMYKREQCTPFGMYLTEKTGGTWNVPMMWDRLFRDLNVERRREEVELFNIESKWVKRGLSLVPTKFGIAFTAKFMNQGGALVHLYIDGSVLVSHGGTEMGQGLHTKVCQVAAQAFGIPIEDVYINDTSTDKVANTQPTAASISTDQYGMATLDACRKIIARINPIREKLGPGATLSQVATDAFFNRIDLSALGFFALSDERCGFDWTKEKPDDFPDDMPENSWKGNAFNYFTQGVACAEVEIDVLTGNHRCTRADVLVDVGSSINPTIDIGQIEGAFTQGMGWSTIEEVVYADDDHTWIRPRGRVFTTGPGTYKIPAFNDVPETFNVSLLENATNPFAVHSSKAIGEPPFFLGASVYYALKDAIRAARKDHHEEGYFELRMPATSERIRMLCADKIAANALISTAPGRDGHPVATAIGSFQPQGSY